MTTVSIFGVGLIGGSFALALRQAGFTGTILGVSSPATIAKALDLHVIDRGATFEQAAQSDLVFLAQPISVILETIPKLAAHLGPATIVTDAGSTKVDIVEQANRHLPPNRFVGGHPMAGKELTGVAAADARLFNDRPWILTTKNQAAEDLVPWLEAIGAKVSFFDPAEHDRTVALTSHLPQFLSTALALTLADQLRAPEIAGPGVIDMTRLAMSSADLWHDISVTNIDNIELALDKFLLKLEELRQNLKAQTLVLPFQDALVASRRLRKY